MSLFQNVAMMNYVLICLMVGVAGFVDSIGGGGGLISLPAYVMGGLPVHQAIATNKMSSSLGTSVAAFHYWKSGYMKWQICVPAIACTIIGAYFGSRLNLIIDEKVLSAILIFLLPLIAIYVVFGKKSLQDSQESRYGKKITILICSITALVIGFYDGFYGPGTGTFLMIVFSGICRLSLNESAGTTKAVNLTSNYISLAVYIYNAQVMYPLGICAGICNMIGCYIGSHTFSKNGSKITRPIILFVLVIFCVKLLYELFFKK